MTLQITVQDITKVERGIIGHGVNCQGVMRSGVAKQLRSLYPKIFYSYSSLCNQHSDKSELLGSVDFVSITPDIIIANMFTQEYYGKDGRVYASPFGIQQSMLRVILMASSLNLDVYIPPIGCGLGGLNWDETVLPLLEEASSLFPEVNITVCNLPT